MCPSAIYIVGREKFIYDLSYIEEMYVIAKSDEYQFAFGEFCVWADCLLGEEFKTITRRYDI